MTDGPTPRRERLEAEQRLLAAVFPTAVIHIDDSVVLVHDYPLPRGWSHEVTDVLVVVPANYPAGCPDNVCARPDLRLVGGGVPASSQGEQTYAGRPWLQFSWHIEKADWNPTSDPAVGSNLVTYLLGAVRRFEEAS